MRVKNGEGDFALTPHGTHPPLDESYLFLNHYSNDIRSLFHYYRNFWNIHSYCLNENFEVKLKMHW
jgi:hypothetical protein